MGMKTEKEKEACRKWRLAHPEKIKQLRQRWGLAHPEKAEEYRKRAFQKFPERERLRAKRQRDKWRFQALSAYGNKCKCCGETESKFLALDHVKSDGAEHKRTVKSLQSSSGLTRWAKKNQYPPSLQILCHNCNSAKAYYGKCPHQEFNAFRICSAN